MIRRSLQFRFLMGLVLLSGGRDPQHGDRVQGPQAAAVRHRQLLHGTEQGRYGRLLLRKFVFLTLNAARQAPHKPIQTVHGLSNYSHLKLGDDRCGQMQGGD